MPATSGSSLRLTVVRGQALLLGDHRQAMRDVRWAMGDEA